MNIKYKLYPPCYLEFFSIGFMALLLGAIIPYLVTEYGISYTVAGFFISSQAFGTLIASLLMPYLTEKIGRKMMILILSPLLPLGLSSILFTGNTVIICTCFLLAGIGRGAASNFNNYIVNEYSTGKAGALNILHGFFAIGAFLAPLVASLSVTVFNNWRLSVIACVVFLFLGFIGYCTMPLDNAKIPMFSRRNSEGSDNKGYLHSIDFYISCAIMFFYVGLEYSANNWFVSYFQATGLMSKSYAATLVSFLWLVILFGRLINSAISQFIKKQTQILINVLGCSAFLCLILLTKDIRLITAGVIGMGFCMAGIYPTCVASIGNVVKGSASGIALFLAVAGVGGMVIPQLIGALADRIGMIGAVSFLIVDAGIVIALALLSFLRARK